MIYLINQSTIRPSTDMDAGTKDLIDRAMGTALEGEYVGRDVLLALLSIDPFSEEAEYLGRAGREVASAFTDNTGRIGSAFGMDLCPCTMNCAFCALGEKWHLFDETYEFTAEEIIGEMRRVMEKGFYQFTIRTTEFYTVEKLCQLIKRIRSEIQGDYFVSLNVGELTLEEAERLYDAGYNAAYHSLRLGEGKDTGFDPQERIDTMRAISESRLALSTGLDPIGIEHTDAEIVDRLELFRELDAATVCVMKRINVAGTPMEGIPMVPEERIAQIASVTRIAGAGKWKNVACSPPSKLALRYGANTFSVTTGANPRFTKQDFGTWSIFDHETAMEFLKDAGYRFSKPAADINSAMNG